LQNKTEVDMSGIEVTERDITQGGLAVHIHIVKPEGVSGKLPVVVFYHGGVWIVGNYENHKRLVRDIVVGTDFAAVFVDYALLPASTYPTQINQAYAALTWVAAHGEEIGVDPTRIAVAGNSLGGNMAAAIALMAKGKNGPALRMEVLLYPAVGADFNTGSYKTYADGRFLSRDFMEFGHNLYTPNLETRKEIYAVPMAATIGQLKGLPRTLIQTVDNDPLRDEGEAYGRKLLEAGVDCSVTRYMNLIHDFQVSNAINNVPGVKESIRQVCTELKDALK
jgi:acetyl esterase